MIRCLLAPLLLAALPGCLTPSDPPLESSPPIPTDHAVAADFVAAYARSLNERNLDAYVALMEQPSGEGHPGAVFAADYTDVDFGDFPWLPFPADIIEWSLETEVAMVRNLFDPDYRGQQLPVASLEARLKVVEELRDSHLHLVETAAEIRIQTVNGEERRFSTDLQFSFVPDDRGYLRVRELRELVADPMAGWSHIRWLYSPEL